MKDLVRYSVLALVLVAGATLGIGALLDPVGRRSLQWAAGIALLVQLVAFAVLLRLRDAGSTFLLAFLGGGAARLGVLGVVGLLTTKLETGLAAAPLLLGLAGYFFALLLLESWFLLGSTRTEFAE